MPKNNASFGTNALLFCVVLFFVLTCVTEVKVLVREFLPVDAHPARAVPLHEVSPLKHEVLDHAVERRPLVPRRDALPHRDGNPEARNADANERRQQIDERTVTAVAVYVD